MSAKHALAASLSLILALPSDATSQEVRNPQTAVESLKIFVLEGQNAVNSIPAMRAIDPVVEVRDENDQPAEGAEVTFELPAAGPGGTFPGGQLKYTARANLQGQAAAPLVPNNQPGRFEIGVTAQLGNRIGRAIVMQTNSDLLLAPGEPEQRRRFFRGWRLLAISGAAAAVIGIVLATRNGKASPTVVITPGGPVFGGPR